MIKSDVPPAALETPHAEWGAAAAATVGSVTVEVDEALSAPEWQMSVDTPSLYFRLQIEGLELIRRLHEFLTADARNPANGEFLLGRHRSENVELLRDDSPGHRCFIVLEGETSTFRLTLSADECRHWADALRDVLSQLGA